MKAAFGSTFVNPDFLRAGVTAEKLSKKKRAREKERKDWGVRLYNRENNQVALRVGKEVVQQPSKSDATSKSVVKMWWTTPSNSSLLQVLMT